MVICAMRAGRVGVALFGIGTVICAALAGMFPRPASAIELLTNGNFEATPVSGNAPGWTRFEQAGSIGQFYLDVPGTTVQSASVLDTPGNGLTPGGGNLYAVSTIANADSSEAGPGAHSLFQSFSLPGNATSVTSVTLRYQFFASDPFELRVLGSEFGLDYTKGTPDSITGEPINQHARIDILRGGASPLSTNASDIIRTVKAPFAQSANEGWENQQVDVTSGLQIGQNYTLRFAVVKNKQELLLGVDNVSLDFIGTVIIPETNTAGLMGLPMLLACAITLIRRRAAHRTP
ncbi:MAG: hypothetical protein H7Y38_00530 [Armatimonadetes bacterium]|nr:hypothetical protein [Armatimonadota bacterium]